MIYLDYTRDDNPFIADPGDILDSFVLNFLSNWAFACGLGLSISLIIVLEAKSRNPIDEKYIRCLTLDMVSTNPRNTKTTIIKEPQTRKSSSSFFSDLFFGIEFNPRFWGVDFKMFLYSVGAVQLEMNVLSFYYFVRQHGGPLIASTVYTSLFTWFLVEYCYFEFVHLYTYDLFAEKMGFKLTWGCFCFYPFFYCIGGYLMAIHGRKSQDISQATAIILAALFFTGWILTRGANMQKYYFKIEPASKRVFWGLMEQRPIQKGSRILSSGFWSYSRHINYFGEILQSIALSACSYLVLPQNSWMSMAPFLYTLYYIVLFVSRERDDHALCLVKYGKEWIAYCKQTPYRIVPYVY